MVRKILTCTAAMIVSWLIFLSSVNAADKPVWRLDGMNYKELPRNFRLTTNQIAGNFSTKGFNELQASASGQPNRESLSVLYNNLREHAKDGAKIYIIDLRQEPHGFVNGYPVSYYVKGNLANYYKGNDGIEDDELEKLNNLRGKTVTFVPLGNFDKAHYKPVKVEVTNVTTERLAATGIGFEYVRFGVTDMMFPAPDVVDDFYSFLNVIDKDDWLHFHCQAGHGRTTTFLVMYDILMNPDVSLEDIVARQHLIGGSDLLANNDDRAEYLRKFYEYAQGRYNGTITSTWSEFILQ